MKKATILRGTETTDRRGLLKIGEVSRLSGVGIEALRFYERQGLLGDPPRTESGYRLYDEEALERLEFIKRAQVLGFSLAEIARIIAEKQAGQSPCAEVREIVRLRLGQLDERLKELRLYRRELAAALKEWDEAGDKEGHICGLIEGTKLRHPVPAPKTLKRGKR
jgi:DNA-binding transcriptional MerR regulator